MNRFRTKKKGKDDGAAEDSSSGFFRRNKKHMEEPKKEFNLDAALPPSDDFRTSLLMTNLSARFSMLREQDDPNTKIGKASDDSVLFPKRQSRLMDYGFGGGLHDIAEVESIKAAPSFTRMDSFASDSESAQARSIMDRARPNEGNNLFGGRQKIYKIPAGAGGLTGRALYEDDVALSAFQRWKLAERERRSFEEAQEREEEAEPRRSESPPPLGYNRRRETSSTTSSASALARNSTAATSVTSQPTASLKDWQSASTAPTSATSTPTLERSVTRTRRLYEQGLTQDMHDQQSSALSRIDTLSRQRTFGSRTPDLGANSPSPTASGFSDRLGDRFAGERRPILTKASAPNLRSISPPTSGSSVGTMDLAIKAPSQPDSKLTFGGSPPLSPPISEAEEHPLLASSLQPADRGKATAMGVFQKPSQPYDESKYAQRQLQLQRGRETPTQRFRTESNASFVTDRSRSSSSIRRQAFESKAEAVKTQPPVQEESAGMTFLDDVDEDPSPVEASETRPFIPSRANRERPSDHDHPALRQAAPPAPAVISSSLREESPAALDAPPSLTEKPYVASPADSPTLGPTPMGGLSAGLSGMVRQHLRSESNTSSIYGLPGANFDTQFGRDSVPLNNTYDPNIADTLGSRANPWTSEEREWARSYYGVEPSLENLKTLSEKDDFALDSKISDRSSNDMGEEADEFANQLADARRRVREKLTSYVESDSSRSGSPTPQGESFASAPPPNSLGISMLKPKSSRGSLIDRSRSIVGSQSKAMKMLGLGSATMSTSPLPGKQSFDEKEIARPIQEEEDDMHDQEQDKTQDNSFSATNEPEADAKSLNEQEENVHPGLRAFRQARRELQRRKELEMLARHQTAQTGQPAQNGSAMPEEATHNPTPRAERAQRQRTPSRERRPPPVYAQRVPSEESRYGRPSGERNRSGSETSGPRSRSASRVTRLRNDSSARDQQVGQLAPSSPTPRQPMLRSPGLPGTDIRRSPIMPPQGYPSSAGPSPLPSPAPQHDGSHPTRNLAVAPPSGRAGYELTSGHPSPVSPINASLPLPPSPFAMGGSSGAMTPTSAGRPSAPQSPSYSTTKSSLDESMKRAVNKKEISEPTFVMSTSRVPTVTLPEAKANPDHNGLEDARSRSRSRSNSGSQGHNAPPLPPINPRRKKEGSRTRAAIDALTKRSGGDEVPIGAPRLPYSASSGSGEFGDENRSSVFSISDDEDIANHRKRLRKVTLDRNGGGRARDNVVTGPPASRTVMAPSMIPRSSGVPGGMI